MKKLLFILALGSALQVQAQTGVPNSGFEQKNNGKLADWSTAFDVEQLSSYTTTYNGQTVSVQPYEGQYFLKLSTKDSVIHNQEYILLGIASTTIPNVGLPDSMVFNGIYFPKIAEDGYLVSLDFIKYDPTNGPMTAYSTSINGDLPAGSSWGRRSEYINYFGTHPDYDSLKITISSANSAQHDPATGNPRFGIGATLLIDHFQLTGTSTGIKDVSFSKETSLQVYPNPASTTASVNYQLRKPGQVSMGLYDIQGREVMPLFSGQQNPGNYSRQVDISSLQPGVYFYKLCTAEGSSTERLIITR